MKLSKIGIDPGVKTGVAVYDTNSCKLTICTTVGIIEAMRIVLNHENGNFPTVHLFVEDARLRKWFGASGREVLQGAGSVKRDCKIWDEFAEYHSIDINFVAPMHNKTKLDAKTFKHITGWEGRTSSHSRDAAMLVFE